MSQSDGLYGITEGAYTSRVRGDDDAVQIRAQNAARARGNLAAMILDRHGIHPSTDPADLPASVKAEMVEIARALGLDRPTRRPGYCACGTPLTITATSAKFGDYKHGMCLPCSREDR